MVAVHCENYAREPVIGLCTQNLIHDTTIEVRGMGWMALTPNCGSDGRCETKKIREKWSTGPTRFPKCLSSCSALH